MPTQKTKTQIGLPKKIFAAFFAVFLSVSCYVVSSAQIDAASATMVFTLNSNSYYLNGTLMTSDVAPFLKSDSTLVPLGVLLRGLGYTVEWVEADQSVHATRADRTLVFYMDKNTAVVNGIQYQMPAPAITTFDRSFGPLRFVVESSGASLIWDATTNTAYIAKESNFSSGRVIMYENNQSKNNLYVYNGTQCNTINLGKQKVISWYTFKGNILISLQDAATGAVSISTIDGLNLKQLRAGYSIKTACEYNNNLLVSTTNKVKNTFELYRYDGTDLTLVSQNFRIENSVVYGDKLIIEKYDNRRDHTLVVFGTDSWEPGILREKFTIRDTFAGENSLYIFGMDQEGSKRPIIQYDGTGMDTASVTELTPNLNITSQNVGELNGSLYALVGQKLVSVANGATTDFLAPYGFVQDDVSVEPTPTEDPWETDEPDDSLIPDGTPDPDSEVEDIWNTLDNSTEDTSQVDEGAATETNDSSSDTPDDTGFPEDIWDTISKYKVPQTNIGLTTASFSPITLAADDLEDPFSDPGSFDTSDLSESDTAFDSSSSDSSTTESTNTPAKVDVFQVRYKISKIMPFKGAIYAIISGAEYIDANNKIVSPKNLAQEVSIEPGVIKIKPDLGVVSIINNFRCNGITSKGKVIVMTGSDVESRESQLVIYNGLDLAKATDVTKVNSITEVGDDLIISVNETTRPSGKTRNSVLAYSIDGIRNVALDMQIGSSSSMGSRAYFSAAENALKKYSIYSYTSPEYNQFIGNCKVKLWKDVGGRAFVSGLGSNGQINMYMLPADAEDAALIRAKFDMLDAKHIYGDYYFVYGQDTAVHAFGGTTQKNAYLVNAATKQVVLIKDKVQIKDVICPATAQ